MTVRVLDSGVMVFLAAMFFGCAPETQQPVPRITVAIQDGKLLIRSTHESLNLNDVVTLDPAAAGVIAGCGVKRLQLNGLTVLDAATASVLAGCNSKALELNGLTTLDAATAQELANYQGFLELGGYSAVELDADAKVVQVITTGLTSLDAATAASLARIKWGTINLCNLKTLDAATATALSQFRGGSLYLDGLATLDAATARALAEFQGGTLFLTGLTVLTDDAAAAFRANPAVKLSDKFKQ